MFLCSIFLQGIVVEIQQLKNRSFLTEETPENGRASAEHAAEFFSKFVQPLSRFNFSGLAGCNTREERFSHFLQEPVTNDWRETLSPPPEQA